MLDVAKSSLPLYTFQERASWALSEAPKPLYLAHDTGLGKTRTAIEALKRMGARRVLVVCPLTAVGVWRQQIERWWPDGPQVIAGYSFQALGAYSGYDNMILLMSYGAFSRETSFPAFTPFQATVLDEAHYVKNSAANRTKAIFRLKAHLGRIIPVSATPSPNHAGELWAVLHHLRPDLILIRGTSGKDRPMQEWEFKARYVAIRSIRVTVKGRTRLVDKIEGSKNVDELRRRIGAFFLRETKKSALPELPPMIYDTLPVGVAVHTLAEFRDVVPAGLKPDNILKFLDTRQNDVEIARKLAALGMAKAPEIVEFARDFLEGNPKEQIVVWAKHHKVIDYLETHLVDYGVSKLDGRDDAVRRKIAEERFVMGRNRVFVGNVQAGGVALTLLREGKPCSTVVFAEASFSPADNYQAASRVHRIGQPNSVMVWFACASGTFDERVQEILARKTDDASKLFD